MLCASCHRNLHKPGKVQKRIIVSVYLPEDIHAEIKEMAVKDHRGVSNLITFLLETMLREDNY